MKVSRRGLVGGLLGGATLAATGSARANDPSKAFSGHPGRFGLLHDTTLCVGCRSCEVACQEVNHIDAPVSEKASNDASVFDAPERRRTTEYNYTVVNRYVPAKEGQPAVFRKHQCMHCNEPCCATVCFVGAFQKSKEGPVVYNPDLCVGCRYCVMACPYYALAYEYDKPMTPRVVRCTMCYDRIVENKLPACAEICPTGAITFGRRDKLLQVARARIAKHPERYIDHVFGEHEFGGTSWLTLTGVPLQKLDLPENASHRPLPELVDGALSFVPIIASAWPGFLLGMYAFSKRKETIGQKLRDDAVTTANERSGQQLKDALAEASKKAAKDKERALQQAVKKAKADTLAEVEAAAQQAKAASDAEHEG